MTRTGIIFLAALAVGLIACPSPGHAKVPKLLEPNGDWTVSRESGVCSAKRSFGEGRETTDLMLQSVGPSRSFLFTVRGFPLQKNKYKKARVRFSFGPDRYSHWHFAAYFATDSEGKGVFRAQDSLADWKERRERGDDHLSFAPDDPRDNSFWQIDEKREAEVDRLTLEGTVAQPVTLHTGVFTEPLGLLRECVERQFREWGIDVAAHVTASRQPKVLNPENTFRATDYPAIYVQKSVSGMVHFRLLVDQQGKPTDCLVLGSVAPDELENHTCTVLMRRISFSPALDANGNAMNSAYASTMFWKIVY